MDAPHLSGQRLIRIESRDSVVNAFGAHPFAMRLQLFDLRFQSLPMRAVLCRVHRLTLEGRVFEPQRVNLSTKPIVLGLDIFPFAHVPIVARCHRMVEP